MGRRPMALRTDVGNGVDFPECGARQRPDREAPPGRPDRLTDERVNGRRPSTTLRQPQPRCSAARINRRSQRTSSAMSAPKRTSAPVCLQRGYLSKHMTVHPSAAVAVGRWRQITPANSGSQIVPQECNFDGCDFAIAPCSDGASNGSTLTVCHWNSILCERKECSIGFCPRVRNDLAVSGSNVER